MAAITPKPTKHFTPADHCGRRTEVQLDPVAAFGLWLPTQLMCRLTRVEAFVEDQRAALLLHLPAEVSSAPGGWEFGSTALIGNKPSYGTICCPLREIAQAAGDPRIKSAGNDSGFARKAQ